MAVAVAVAEALTVPVAVAEAVAVAAAISVCAFLVNRQVLVQRGHSCVAVRALKAQTLRLYRAEEYLDCTGNAAVHCLAQRRVRIVHGLPPPSCSS